MKALREAIALRKEVEKQERIERVMNAARSVFLKKGYLGTKIRDIALEAQLSPGLIYFYFKGKDEIYGNICKEAFHILLGLLKETSKTPGSPYERVNAMAYAYLKFYRDHNDYFNIISFKDMGFKKVGLSEKLQEELDRLSYKALSTFKAVVHEVLSDLDISKEKNDWPLTFALWAIIEGSLHIHKRGHIDSFHLNLEDVIKLQLGIIKGGIKQS
jgi:AcrR family transcriptional regulator